MDTISDFENTESGKSLEAEAGEREPFVVNNLVSEIEASYNGAPLSPETSEILREFEGERTKNRGLGIFSLIEDSKRLEEKIKNLSQKCKDKVQTINPEVPLEEVPLYLLSSPVEKNASALNGEGIAINTRSLVENNKGNEYLENTIVHEATHIFIKRLGKEPDWESNDFKRQVSNFLWFEGLAQYMQPHPEEVERMFKQDAEKWPKILSSWFNTESKEKKAILIENILNMESFKKIMEYRHGQGYENGVKAMLEKSSQDEALTTLIVREGFGYHIGKLLWEQDIQKGNSLKELVMKGSKDIDNWIV